MLGECYLLFAQLIDGLSMQTFIKAFLLLICLNPLAFAGKEVVFSVLTLDQITKQVISQHKSKVLAAKTELLGGKQVHVIKILTSDGRVQYLKIDAETGKNIR